ncbi:glutathione S-transferase family protein [Rhodobacteraceae bacterium D3-12]|nr:glutathione S-transferase family protein [Rhodobacteraceae bacterium D3-12]
MSQPVRLIGFEHSVYTRVARIALAEKGVAVDFGAHDPFRGQGVENPHPFGRVPVLCHGDFEIYETAAITAYVDAAFEGADLMPDAPHAVARVEQVVGMVDAYVYWPLVRQVHSHGAFRPAMGEGGDAEIVAEGLRAAPGVLAALEAVAVEGLGLGARFTRADCHLAPMIWAFVQVAEGAEMLRRYPALSAWWARVEARASIRMTEVALPSRS